MNMTSIVATMRRAFRSLLRSRRLENPLPAASLLAMHAAKAVAGLCKAGNTPVKSARLQHELVGHAQAMCELGMSLDEVAGEIAHEAMPMLIAMDKQYLRMWPIEPKELRDFVRGSLSALTNRYS